MTSRTGRRGFTLVEVLVSTAILATGIIFIFESFFICMNAFSSYSDYLNILPWTNEKLWRAEDEIACQGNSFLSQTEGEFNYAGRTYLWQLSSRLTNKETNLYRIDLSVSWERLNKKRELTRHAYVFQK